MMQLTQPVQLAAQEISMDTIRVALIEDHDVVRIGLRTALQGQRGLTVERSEAEVETVDVEKLLRDILDLLNPPATFTIELAANLPVLPAKRLRLEQVFTNLIGNAIKHHPRLDGRIRVSVADQGDFYAFAVSDDGAGIAPEFHDRVFAIFQTLDANHSTDNTGIGLAIVKKIVETEGGTIYLESELGKGATFCFTWSKQPRLPL